MPAVAPTPEAGSPRAITVLSGGIGGAHFLRGVLRAVELGRLPHDAAVTVIANTADDMWVHGLRVCPDLDTVMYTLGGGIDPERGWGRRDESWHAREELAAYAVDPTWFSLGDRDLATHLIRTRLLSEGQSLSAVTAVLCRRWRPGVRLLPMSDDFVETHLVVADPEAPAGRRTVHFQEYWVRLGARVPALDVTVAGLARSTPAPGVLDAIAGADLVLLPPSNPVVSIGTILGVPGVRAALRAATAPVVGLSPIVAGSHVHGMARQLLECLGVEVSAGAVARHYGDGLLDGWLVDDRDADQVAAVEAAGIRCRAVPLMMTDPDATAAMVAAAVGLAREGTGPRGARERP